MLTYITAHGFKFAVEGQGFVRAKAEQDFEQIVSETEDALRAMPADRVAELHTGAIFTDDGAADDALYGELNSILNGIAAGVMAGWHNPNGAHVEVSAA